MTNTYKYSQQIALHEKARNILELKIQAIQRQDKAQDNLTRWDAKAPNDLFPYVNDRRTIVADIDTWGRAIIWLNKYYSRITKEVCSCLPVVEVKEWSVNPDDVAYGKRRLEWAHEVISGQKKYSAEPFISPKLNMKIQEPNPLYEHLPFGYPYPTSDQLTATLYEPDKLAEKTEYQIPGWPYLPNHYGGIVEPEERWDVSRFPD